MAQQPKPVKGDDAVLFFEQFMMVACGLMNLPRANGRLTPTSGQYHTPCPFGKKKPDTECFSCQHVRVMPLIRRRTTEKEMDARQEGNPPDWVPSNLIPYGREG